MTTIAIDMDETLAHWEDEFHKRFSLLVPQHRRLPRMEYDIFKGREIHHEAVQAVLDDPTFYDKLVPIRGAYTALEEMRKEGYDIIILTKPTTTNRNCASAKYRWVNQFFGRYYEERTILSFDKTRVRADILIDDHPNVVGHDLPIWKLINFTAPYNLLSGHPHLSDWLDWRSVIEPLENSILALPESPEVAGDEMANVDERCRCGSYIITSSRSLHKEWQSSHNCYDSGRR